MPDYSSLDIPKYVYEVPTDYEVYVEYGDDFDFAKKQLYRNYLKTLLSERQGHKCCYCGLAVTDVPNSRRQSTIEHVIPQSRGGKWDLWNCVVACSKCNRRRGNNELPEEKLVMLGLTDGEQFSIPYMWCDSGEDTVKARVLGREAYETGKKQEDNPYLAYSVMGMHWSMAFVIAQMFADKGVSHPQRKESPSRLTRISPAGI